MYSRVKRLNFKTTKYNLIIGLYDGKNSYQELDELFGGVISKSIKKGEISTNAGTVTEINTLGKIRASRIYFVGLGKASETTKEVIRKSFSSLSKKLEGENILVFDTFECRKIKQEDFAELIAETVEIGKYKFDEFKSNKKNKEITILVNSQKDYSEYFARGLILGQATNNARTLVNKPHNHMNAIDLAEYAVSVAKENNLEIKVYDKREIEKMKMGAFLAVNKGSLVPPKLIYIKYQGKEKWENPIALVGKGLMFDTGGYNLKSNSKNMKTDMAGSASVLGAIEAIAKLKIKENVMVIIAATDNMIGKDAYLPDDIITSAKGKTIEIFSTDAEGRLTLVDAVWFAQKEGAKRVVDIATLTGSIVAALGQGYVGAFTNKKTFLNKLEKISIDNGEPVWHMPIGKHFEKAIKGKIADINNAGVRLGGACAAAAFIQEFIEEGTEWIHLDIAGTAATKDTSATGVMVRSLTKLME